MNWIVSQYQIKLPSPSPILKQHLLFPAPSLLQKAITFPPSNTLNYSVASAIPKYDAIQPNLYSQNPHKLITLGKKWKPLAHIKAENQPT